MGVDIEKLEALAKAATPGPWKQGPYVPDGIFSAEGMILFDDCTRRRNFTNNIAYITAACNAVPELIARVRELERQREWLAKKCEELSDDVEDSFMPHHIPTKEWIKRAEHAAKDE